jgi:hypothetical protein
MNNPSAVNFGLEREAQAIRDSGVLGRPGPLSRLFDFLLTRTAGPAPKELEIAIEVFGKRLDFDVAQDSVVRVYVHKLRKRLDEFYARHARPGRIIIPRGEYRLVFEAAASALHATDTSSGLETSRRRPLVALAAIASGALAIGALLMWAWLDTLGASASERELKTVRRSAVWGPLFDDDLPITIVVGDYYLLGETDAAGNVARLVREFFINSQADFIDHLELDPEWMQRYRNLDLTYLPTAVAFAIHELTPIFAPKERVRVMLMSDLDGATLANSHIVYVGFLSGLGMLGDPVFDVSRLHLGGTYDELVDPASRRTYVARQPETPGGGYTDYGYFAALRGPQNNRIVIAAGTRDLGVMQTAEALARSASVSAIDAEAGGAPSFEGLIEVHGVAKTSLSAKRLFVAQISKDQNSAER